MRSSVTNLTLRILNQSCFTLYEEGTAVTCPNGSELKKVSWLYNKDKNRFACRSACKGCAEKCTTSAFTQVDLFIIISYSKSEYFLFFV